MQKSNYRKILGSKQHPVFSDPGKINSLLSGKYAKQNKTQNKRSPLYSGNISFVHQKHTHTVTFHDM